MLGVRGLVLGLAAASTVVTLAGCGGGGKKAGPQLHGTVIFAVLAPVEHVGPLGVRARDLTAGARLAVAEINGTTGVLGKRLKLEVMDDGCNQQVAYEAAKGIVEESDVIAGALGGICDTATAREVAVVDSGGVPFLVTSANGANVVTPDVHNAYLMNGTLHQQSLSAVYWMNYRHAQRLALIADASDSSQALVQGIISLVNGQTPRLVSLQKVPVGRTDLGTEARAALVSHPNFIYWAGSPAAGGALAKALHANGFKGTFTASAASDDPAFLRAAGSGGNGALVTATSTAENTPTAKRWLATFRARYHRDPGLDALQAYDAVRELAQAATQAKSVEPAQIAANLPKLKDSFTTFLGVVRYATDHTLLYDNRVVLVVKNGRFAWDRSLRTDSLQ
jgi:branched-chain amino acid transport system substrate-binding protein